MKRQFTRLKMKTVESHTMPEKSRSKKVAVLGRKSPLSHFATYLQTTISGKRLLAANEADENSHDKDSLECAFIENPDVLTLASNESGKALLVPFCQEFVNAILPNGEKKKVLQVFDEDAAQEIVSEYNGMLNRFKRTITGLLGIGSVGIPIYYRHPDADPDHIDNREYGRADALEVGVDGLYGVKEYNEFGERLLKEVQGLKISPTWWLREITGYRLTPGSVATRPRKLKSIGLTQFPNIRTAVAVNENPQSKKTMKPELLKALLALLAFPNERIDATINGEPDAISITEVNNAFAPFTTASNEAQRIPDLEKQINDLTAEKTTAETELTAANEAIVGFKETLAANEVEAALSAGKIAPSEKDERIKTLVEATDFAVACNELSEIKDGAAVKNKSVTGNLAQQQSEGMLAANEAQDQFNDLVEANRKDCSYDAAYNKTANSPEGKKLLKVINGE